MLMSNVQTDELTNGHTEGRTEGQQYTIVRPLDWCTQANSHITPIKLILNDGIICFFLIYLYLYTIEGNIILFLICEMQCLNL